MAGNASTPLGGYRRAAGCKNLTTLCRRDPVDFYRTLFQSSRIPSFPSAGAAVRKRSFWAIKHTAKNLKDLKPYAAFWTIRELVYKLVTMKRAGKN